MKNKILVIDSPNSKNPPKIFGNLCGTKPHSKTNDFDDFFNNSNINSNASNNFSLLSPQILLKLEYYVNNTELPTSILKNYSLIEDFCILLSHSKGSDFENILPLRSNSGIKSRYYKRLRFLKNEDMNQIINYADEKGINNKSLLFSKKGNFQGIIDGNEIVLLQDDEEKINKQENIIKTHMNIDEEKNKSENISLNNENFEEEEEENMKEENNRKLEDEEKLLFDEDSKIQEEPLNYLEEHSIEEPLSEIKKKHQNNIKISLNICCKTLGLLLDLNNNKKLPVLISKDIEIDSISTTTNYMIIKDFSTNNRELLEGVTAEAIRILIDLQSVFKKNIRWIIQDLYKVSGSIDDLIEFYTDEENRQNILWNTDEDSILEDAKSYHDQSVKLLIKYKGLERVKTRIKFKGFKNFFEI